MTRDVKRALARVDVGAVRRNCRHLRSLLAPGAELCAVVKADAYGHGAADCARAALSAGATWLAVASADEAAGLRAEGIEARMLVMGALTGADVRTAVGARADVVAWNEALVRELSSLARSGDGPAGVHVKLDTGMGRLGTKEAGVARDVAAVVASDDALELVGVMTHFATADERGDDYFPAQLGAFARFVDEVRKSVPGVIAHAANSAAVYRAPEAHFDLVRCGIAIYGLDPFQEDPAARELEPALSLESYVADVKRFEPGDSAGYGRRWLASEPSWVAVAPIGYGDGVRRDLSNNADVLVRGRRRRLVGAVSMDNVTLDLGPDTDVGPGDRVVLIGEQAAERILCEEQARRVGTINYEITCGISPRVPRVHEDG